MSIRPTKRLSAFDRLKARLTRNKNLTDSPDRVSEIAAETKQRLENSRDLRYLQGELLQKQLQWRADAPIRRDVSRMQTLLRRGRIRRPIASAVAKDVFADHEGELYLSTSNGQLLRADKQHKNPVIRKLVFDRLTADAQSVGLELKPEVVA